MTSAAESRDQKTAFILGNIEFVLLHELAHLIVDDKGVPQLGPPESVADYIAINMAITGGDNDDSKEFLTQALISAATAFAISWQSAQEQNRPMPYWDTHSLGIQRFYSSICLLYGSAPAEFSQLGEYLPEQRRAGCPAEYQLGKEAFTWLVANFSASPEHASLNEPIEFHYGPVRSKIQDKFLKEIQKVSLIENTVNAIDAQFGLERPLAVKLQTCRSPQATWQPSQRELIVCYEMLDAFSRIYLIKNQQPPSN